MNRRSALSLAGVVAVGLAAPVAASPKYVALRSPSKARLSTAVIEALAGLPSGVRFEALSEPATPDQIRAFSSLISVSRMTWGTKANLGGACYEPVTGGPQILLVEKGSLRISMFPSSDQKGDFPRLIRRSDGTKAKAITVLPNSQIDLQVGDLLSFPNGSSCGMYGPSSISEVVTFLEFRGLTSYFESESSGHPDLQMNEQLLDLRFGISTENPPAPPSVILGSLTVDPVIALPLSTLSIPMIFSVNSGSCQFMTNMAGAVVRRSGTQESAPSESLAVKTVTTMNAGDASYVLPGTDGNIVNKSGDNLVLSIAVIDPTANNGDSTPIS